MMTVVSMAFASQLLVVSTKSLFPAPNPVRDFLPAEINSTVLQGEHTVWLIDYYADWCPHCVHFAPVWTGAANRLANAPGVKIGALNCAAHDKFCSEIGVNSYPTMRVYHLSGAKDSEELKGGKVDGISGNSDVAAIVKWVQKHVGEVPESSVTTPSASPPSSAPSPASSGPYTGAKAHLADAEVAVLYSMQQGVFLAAEQSDSGPTLRGKALEDFMTWLRLLAVLLPRPKAREDVAALLSRVQKFTATSGELQKELWDHELESQSIGDAPPSSTREPQWHQCKTFTCGLWMLFHGLTLAASEHGKPFEVAGFLDKAGGEPQKMQPGDVLLQIRTFIHHFFGCKDCVAHFEKTYDSCDFQRCDLSLSDGRGHALWLWQVHNAVTARVKTSSKPWPSPAECGKCWIKSDDALNFKSIAHPFGQPNETAVYEYMLSTYTMSEDLLQSYTMVEWDTEQPPAYGLWVAAVASLAILMPILLLAGWSMKGIFRRGYGPVTQVQSSTSDQALE